ncbi:MAG TPA: RDD family protein [Bacteroidia bacterium]
MANILIIYIFAYKFYFLEPVFINTSQNVVIDYEPAGLGNRILAGILDLLFKFGFIITLSIIFSILGISSGRLNNSSSIVIFFIIILLPYLLYDFLFETFMHGQTIGKKLMKIKVLKLDGTQPSVGSYLIRWLIRLLEIDIFQGLIAIVCIAASKNSQRLGDMAAGTTVIQIRRTVTIKDTILQQQKHEEYTIVFKQVTLLTDADIQLLKDVYDFSIQTQNTEVLSKLALKIKNKTGIVTDMKDGRFINTLLKDYNHYQLEK